MDGSAFAFSLDEANAAKMGQMEGKRGIGNPRFFTDSRGIDAIGSGLDQQAKDGEAGFMPQGSEDFSTD